MSENDQPKRYRKKPVVIEAMPFDGTNAVAIQHWMEAASGAVLLAHVGPDRRFIIQTLEGGMEARPGDYIIKGVQGEFYPCRSDIFAATYEPEGPACVMRPAPESPVDICRYCGNYVEPGEPSVIVEIEHQGCPPGIYHAGCGPQVPT